MGLTKVIMFPTNSINLKKKLKENVTDHQKPNCRLIWKLKSKTLHLTRPSGIDELATHVIV